MVYFKVGNMAGPPSFDWGRTLCCEKKFLSEFVYHLDDSSFREVVPKESLHLIHLLPVPLHHANQVDTLQPDLGKGHLQKKKEEKDKTAPYHLSVKKD